MNLTEKERIMGKKVTFRHATYISDENLDGVRRKLTPIMINGREVKDVVDPRLEVYLIAELTTASDS